jgi:hypothetical protein
MQKPFNPALSSYRIKKLRSLEAAHSKANHDWWKLAEKYQSQGWAWYAATAKPDVVALQKLQNELQFKKLGFERNKGVCTICQEKIDRTDKSRPASGGHPFFRLNHQDCYYTVFPERFEDDMERQRNAISVF